MDDLDGKRLKVENHFPAMHFEDFKDATDTVGKGMKTWNERVGFSWSKMKKLDGSENIEIN